MPDAALGDAVPDGYRRTVSYRAGVAVSSWPGRRHACFASRVRDLVVQLMSGSAPWDAVAEVDAGLPGAPAGLRITGQVREHAPGDAVITTTVEYPESGPEAGEAGRACRAGGADRAGRADGADRAGGADRADGVSGADTAAGNGGYVGVTRVTATRDSGVTAIAGGHAVRITGCRELTLLTRVEAFRDAEGIGAARARALTAVATAPAGEPRLLLAEHARAHASAFGDVALDLGAAAADRGLPVGELLARQAARPDQPLPALLEKLFDSGRYLLLSASGLLPSRLTGLWQGDWNPAWSGAITTDANLGLQLAGAVTTDVPTAVYNADAACALPGVLTEMLVDSVPADESGPGRIELLPAVPDFLPTGRLRGARTLAGVRVAELRWDAVAGQAEAVLLSAADREADVSCRGSAPRRRVTLPAGTPVRMTWEHGGG